MEYKLGTANKVADALSRKLTDENEAPQLYSLTIPVPDWLQTVAASYASCADLQLLMKRWKTGGIRVDKYQERNGIIFRKGKIILSTDDDF